MHSVIHSCRERNAAWWPAGGRVAPFRAMLGTGAGAISLGIHYGFFFKKFGKHSWSHLLRHLKNNHDLNASLCSQVEHSECELLFWFFKKRINKRIWGLTVEQWIVWWGNQGFRGERQGEKSKCRNLKKKERKRKQEEGVRFDWKTTRVITFTSMPKAPLNWSQQHISVNLCVCACVCVCPSASNEGTRAYKCWTN